MSPRHILIVEDEHALGTALSFAVRRIGHLPVLTATGTGALQSLKQQTFSLVVLDIGLPDMRGMDVLKELRQTHPHLPVLMITAHGTLEHALAARQHGATEYLVKPLDLRQFEKAIQALLQPASTSSPSHTASASSDTTGKAFLGDAPALREVFSSIARACSSDVPVMITGGTGSGKTLVTQVIHANSRHRDAGLSVFDGSGAMAESGTVVIEELVALPAGIQAELSSRLASGGSVRWLATSTLDPLEAMKSGLLSAELYYAFSALNVDLPPLRERSTDIATLASRFLAARGSGASLSPAALAALESYPWPGNVRELRQVLQLASDLSNHGVIFPSHLPPQVRGQAGTPAPSSELETALSRWLATQQDHSTYDQLTDQIETILLRKLLERHEGKPTHLANALQMNRATLRQKLRRLGLGADQDA